jgi:LEA14-like dessication related protein
MLRRHFLRDAALLGGALPLGGCQTLAELLRTGLRAPEVLIKEVALQDQQLDRVTLMFTSELRNPNPISMSLAGLGYGLEVEGHRLARGNIDERLTLKASDASALRFPVEFALGATSAAILKLLTLDEAKYELDAAFRFAVPRLGNIEVPLRHRSTFPVPKLPRLSVEKVDFTSIGIGGLGMRILTHVVNPNRFPLPVDSFRFAFALNGRTVLKNDPLQDLTLKAKQTRELALDLTCSLADVGITVASLVQAPLLRWELDAELKSGPLRLPFDLNGKVKLA